jgi:hypothetical protein
MGIWQYLSKSHIIPKEHQSTMAMTLYFWCIRNLTPARKMRHNISLEEDFAQDERHYLLATLLGSDLTFMQGL